MYFQTLWRDDTTVRILLDTVWVFSILILLLFITLMVWRIYLIQKEKTEKKKSRQNEQLIFSYLENKVSLLEIVDYLEEDKSQIPTFVTLCRHLLQDLEGELERKIQQIFESKVVQQHFKQKISYTDAGKIAEALLFFKQCRKLDVPTVNKIQSLLTHENNDIAFAAALALVKSIRIKVQYYALREICKRPEITKISVLELLLIFSDTDEPDFNKRGELILELINSSEIPFKFRLVLIKGMGEIGFLKQAPALFNLLKTSVEESQYRNEALICTLVEALGKLYYTNIVELLYRLVDSDSKQIKISCAKALGALGGGQSIQLLDTLFKDPDRDVRYEAMLQLLKIGEHALTELPDISDRQYPEIEKRTLQEISEIKDFRYG